MGESIERRCEYSVEGIHQNFHRILQLVMQESSLFVTRFASLFELLFVMVAPSHEITEQARDQTFPLIGRNVTRAGDWRDVV